MPTRAEIREIHSLRQRKHRDELGRFVVEGKAALDLLSEGATALRVFLSASRREDLEAQLPHPGAAEVVPDKDFARMSRVPSPSGILAVFPLARRTWIAGDRLDGFTLALDGIQDPGNLGTILRIADWYGCSRVLCTPETVDVVHPKVIDASMGSFHRVPVFHADLPASLREGGVPVIACDLSGESLHTTTLPAEAVFVIGAEGPGLSDAVRATVSGSVTIPRFGRAESLNAAIAAAVVCDAFRRGQ